MGRSGAEGSRLYFPFSSRINETDCAALHNWAILHIVHTSLGFRLSSSVTSQPNYIHSQKEELEAVVLFRFFFLFCFHKKLWLVDTPVSQQLGKDPIHYVQYQKKLFCFFRDSVDVGSSSMKRSTNMGKLSLWCVYNVYIKKRVKLMYTLEKQHHLHASMHLQRHLLSRPFYSRIFAKPTLLFQTYPSYFCTAGYKYSLN